MSPRILAYSLIAVLTWTSQIVAQSVVLPPSKSNTLIQVSSSTSQQLSNGLGDIFVGRTNQDGQGPATISIRRGLIAFDIVDNIPAGATITGVSLAMDDVMGLNGNQMVTLSQMYRDWGEGTSFFSGGQGAPATNGDATWYYPFYNASNPSASPAWALPGGEVGVDFSASVSAAALFYAGTPGLNVIWSSASNPAMLTDVQQWLATPATNFGWIVLGNEDAGQTAQRFGGKHASAPESAPSLTVRYAPTFTWTGSAGNAAWTSSGNWTSSGSGSSVPSSPAAIVLGGSSAISGTVDLVSAAPSVSYLAFNANKATTITSSALGGGQLTLDNDDFPAQLVVSGSGQAIDNKVDVILNSDAQITINGSSDELSIAGNISSGTAALGIVKDGPGTLILSGSNTYRGGTTVDEGTLLLTNNMALPDGSNLTVGSGSAFTPSPIIPALIPSTTAVPEPETFALLAAGLVAGLPMVRSGLHRRRWGR